MRDLSKLQAEKKAILATAGYMEDEELAAAYPRLPQMKSAEKVKMREPSQY